MGLFRKITLVLCIAVGMSIITLLCFVPYLMGMYPKPPNWVNSWTLLNILGTIFILFGLCLSFIFD